MVRGGRWRPTWGGVAWVERGGRVCCGVRGVCRGFVFVSCVST